MQRLVCGGTVGINPIRRIGLSVDISLLGSVASANWSDQTGDYSPNQVPFMQQVSGDVGCDKDVPQASAADTMCSAKPILRGLTRQIQIQMRAYTENLCGDFDSRSD
jgi:hypothetical protein